MKRIVAHVLLGLTGLMLSGCPIFPRETECFDNYDCPSDYYCSERGYCVRPGSSDGGSGGSTLPGTVCTTPSACGINETCGPEGRCHVGDCSFTGGCISPYSCILIGYNWQCTLGADGGAGGAGGSGGSAGTGGDPPTGGTGGDAGTGGGDAGTGGGDAGTGGGTAGTGGAPEAALPVYCGNPADCAAGEVCTPDGTCQPGSCADLGCIDGYACDSANPPVCEPVNSASCMLDGDCSVLGATYKCISGKCTDPADQCVDKTQCPSANNQKCVEGKCITSCVGDVDCPDGTHCDTSLGVCTLPAVACTITNDCGDPALVCVAGACVTKCGVGSACDLGFVCVANGCVPDTKPAFICSVEGDQDACQAGSVCLHHGCYISCTTDPEDSCANNQPGLDVCKDVTTSSGQYSVCGSTSNLGSECDPTVTSQSCSGGKVCIDGFCR